MLNCFKVVFYGLLKLIIIFIDIANVIIGIAMLGIYLNAFFIPCQSFLNISLIFVSYSCVIVCAEIVGAQLNTFLIVLNCLAVLFLLV